MSDEEISKVPNKYKKILVEMDNAYQCIRTLPIDDILIEKTRIHIKIHNNFVERIKIISYTFSSFIGKSYSETNELYRWWYC